MSDTSLINIGELSKPATVLVEKVSAAIGVLYEPHRIRREAEANADAALVEAKSRIQIGELERRALTRFVEEQTREQKNIEDITSKALPNLNPQSDPSGMDEDWISDFFGKCRRVSNKEMQTLWASLLAGEANKPGSVSKRTVDFVAAMDRSDAEIFNRVCRFSCNSLNDTLIFDTSHQILQDNQLTWADLSHLETIGLIKLGTLAGFTRTISRKVFRVVLAGETLDLTIQEGNGKNGKWHFSSGMVLLTKIGHELRGFVNFEPAKGFYDFCVESWTKEMDCVLSSPYPRIQTN